MKLKYYLVFTAFALSSCGEGFFEQYPSNDITEGKRTLIVVHALSNSDERERLIEILSSRTKDPAQLEEAVAIMERSGSIDYARDYAEELVNSAKERITTILDPSLSRDLLVSMADWFVERLQ